MKSTEVASNAGEQYYGVTSECKKFLEQNGIRVVAVVGDNATGVQNALMRYAHTCSYCVTVSFSFYISVLKVKIRLASA
jgi:hypothetical protein